MTISVMKLLMLGGTRFLGRALVDDALARGWEVTVLHRGLTGAPPSTAEVLFADRTDQRAMVDALGDRRWDFVVDTWSGSPRVVAENARILRGHVDRYAYVSSVSAYQWGLHVDETSPVVAASATSDDNSDYASAKRGAELAVLESFPEVLLARAGLILGPHEDIGRLPWWLRRIAAGGRVVAPGAPTRPLQYVDVRDVASFVLSGLAAKISGAYDVISASGHTTTSGLLEACVDATGSDAELVWIDEGRLAAAGAQPWTQLPCWVPQEGEFAGFLEADTTKAARAGLQYRPVEDTVRDTWEWMQQETAPTQREDRAVHGLPSEIERELLAAEE
uniref:NAD-dependent epimerase/dehydratase family protein n=1 Tax=Rhodococcus erythropolis TaxID=1833 RepID=UPI00209BEF07|nr:NAD-dependent epimerase/dehydratase family protein [Rhodococcus erythropolis]